MGEAKKKKVDRKANKRPRMNLTEKQENFCFAYCENGFNATKAYLSAYSVKTGNMLTVGKNAHALLKNTNVASKIKEIRMAKVTPHVLSIEERKSILSELAMEGDTRAIDLLNKMEAVYDEKADVNVNIVDRPVIKKLTKEDIAEIRKGMGE